MRPNYTVAGRYRIIKPLGEGGMADVYLAHDLILDRDVSVKLLRLDLRDDPATVRRFQREAMAASELVSPHIVSVYDVGEENGMQYLVMEYVPGMDLKTYIRAHFPIPYPTVVDLMEQILDAVAVAHSHDIIHRDLKPQNVLVNDQGLVKISDFGIAVISNESSMTQTNTVLGSVHYLSPEQARGGMATKKSDLYALGIILYELLTGSVPFEGETAVSVALKHSQSEMPSVRDFDDRIPQALENVVLQATAKDPAARYASVEAMAADLSTALSPERSGERRFEPIVTDGATKVIPIKDIKAAAQQMERSTTQETGPVPTVTEKAPTKKRKRIGWWIAGIICALLVILLAWLWFQPNQATVPNVAGMSTSRAETTLKNSNLAIGKTTKQTSDTMASGKVIKTTPKIDRQVKANAKIDLVVSSGVKKVSVDDYTGEDYSTARRKLIKQGLTVKKETTASSTVAKGVVMEQDVLPGKAVKKDSTITLTVSSGVKQVTVKTVKMPDFAGKSKNDVQDWADDHDLSVSFSTQNSDSVDENKVISQSPISGTKVLAGAAFAVVISNGPALSTTQATITIPYKAPDASSNSDSDSSSSSSSPAENDVKIYIEDHDKKISDVYQELQITKDTTVTLPFTLAHGKSGRYTVVRDGKTIMTNNNVSGN
ncbi:Stk1 family PASTA domain-containing Ser/Thr kinase [Furfurilactobacillus sp. WILCCON 0119]